MSIGKKATVGVVWSIIEGWGSHAVSLLIFFLLARLLSPEAFGLVAMANVVLAFMTVFLDQGFAQALIQRQDLEPEHLDTAFWINVAIGGVLASLGIAGAGAIATGFNQPQLAPIVRCFCALFVITSLSNVQRALLEREFAFKAIARRSLLGLICGGGVGLSLAFLGFGVWSLVGQQLVGELVGSLVLWQASAWRPGFKVSKPHFDQLFSFGISLLALNFVGFFNNRGNDFLIGYFLGPTPLGYYAIAQRVLDVSLQLLVRTTSQVALPTFSRLREDLNQLRKVFYTATQLTSLIAFPAFLGLFILAPEVIVLVFGEQWQPAVPIVQVLAFAGIVQAISFFKGHILVAMGKPSWRLWQSLLSITLNLIGFAIAFRWGIVAIAVAYTVRRYLVFPVGQWAIYLVIRVSWPTYLRQFVVPLLASGGMVAVMLATRQVTRGLVSSNLLIASVSGLMGAITYATLIWLRPPAALTQLARIGRLTIANKFQK